jgi:energy-coupling factor transporter transmembrane protein EcfT
VLEDIGESFILTILDLPSIPDTNCEGLMNLSLRGRSRFTLGEIGDSQIEEGILEVFHLHITLTNLHQLHSLQPSNTCSGGSKCRDNPTSLDLHRHPVHRIQLIVQRSAVGHGMNEVYVVVRILILLKLLGIHILRLHSRCKLLELAHQCVKLLLAHTLLWLLSLLLLLWLLLLLLLLFGSWWFLINRFLNIFSLIITWNEWLHLELAGFEGDVKFDLGVTNVIRNEDSIVLSIQTSRCDEETRVKWIVGIELNGSGRTFGETPEWLALLSLGIQGIHMEELSDIIVEVLLESSSSIQETVIKVGRIFLEYLLCLLQILHLILIVDTLLMIL